MMTIDTLTPNQKFDLKFALDSSVVNKPILVERLKNFFKGNVNLKILFKASDHGFNFTKFY
jgi:hypothetical protein